MSTCTLDNLFTNTVPTLTTTSSTFDFPTWTINIDNLANNIGISDKKRKKSISESKKSIPGIKQIYFNEKEGYTTIVWKDGSPSTVVHCGEGENFERYMGFCAAVCKKLFGSTTGAKKLMDDKDAELAKKRKLEARQKKIAERLEIEAKNREKKKKREDARLAKLFAKLKEFDSSLEESNETEEELNG